MSAVSDWPAPIIAPMLLDPSDPYVPAGARHLERAARAAGCDPWITYTLGWLPREHWTTCTPEHAVIVRSVKGLRFEACWLGWEFAGALTKAGRVNSITLRNLLKALGQVGS